MLVMTRSQSPDWGPPPAFIFWIWDLYQKKFPLVPHPPPTNKTDLVAAGTALRLCLNHTHERDREEGNEEGVVVHVLVEKGGRPLLLGGGLVESVGSRHRTFVYIRVRHCFKGRK